jgi:hypothetical protein
MVRGLAIVLLFGTGIYLGAPYLLAGAGRYLVTQDTLVRADLAVVLPGDLFLSVPEAARIYHEGLAPKILLINESRPRGQEDLLRAGIRYPDTLEASLQLLTALRVPRQAILTIPDRAESLQVEADVVSRVVAGRSVRTLIVITSKAQSRRARQVFVTRLDGKVRLVIHPVPGDPFDPERWWRERTDARQTVWEYAALLDWWRSALWRKLLGAGETAPPPVTVR